MSDTPDLPDDDDEGTELLQVWLVGEGTLHCSINPVSTDPEFWSQILADLTQHVAGLIADEKGLDPDAILREIQEGVIKNLNEPPEEDA